MNTLTTTHLLQLSLVVCLLLFGYSLVMTGRRGWGWFVLVVFAGVITTIGMGVLSLFLEVANAESMRDWDED